MTVGIIGFSIRDGIVTIETGNCDELNYQRLQRVRDGYIQRTIEFVFNTSIKNDFLYLRNFLKRQKKIKEQKPATWGEALNAVIGTVVNISGKYLNRAA